MRRNFLGAIIAGLAVVGFCAILLAHDPLLFWNDDYELSILPVFADVARGWSGGHLPLLSPYSWVCGNLAGEFQYGTFSIFINTAVVLIWKFPLTFPQQAAALSIAHLFVLAAGAFLLARGRKLSIPLSIFVGLIASLNGWIICWGATDWFGALGAFAWLPWCWWAMEKSIAQQTLNAKRVSELSVGRRTLSVGRSLRAALWPAPFVYLLVTGGFPYTILMLVLLVAWLSIKSLSQTKSLMSILPMLFGVALGFVIAAPAWLALFDYAQGSARSMQTADAHWQWIVPWRALPGFILPCWTVNWADFSTRYVPHGATELATGLVAPAALIAGFLWRPRMLLWRMKWEFLLLAVVLLLCMIPTAGVFRWSFRWLPFFHLVLALCAAQVLQIRRGSPTGATSTLLLIVLTIAMSILGTAGEYGATTAFVYLQIAVVWALAERFLRRVRFDHWTPVVASCAFLLATYLCIPANCGVPKYNLSQQLLKAEPLDPHRLYLSIYPEPEHAYRIEKKPEPVGQLVRPGSTSMWAGLHFVNGYSPILPAGVAREFDFRIHGEINLHEAEYLLWSQSGAGGLLEQLGVDGLVVALDSGIDPALGSDWEFVTSNTEAAVYHRVGEPIPRVRSIASIDSRPNEQFAVATISEIQDSRNWMTANVDVPNGNAPALLTFSRPFFRGYEARIENQKLRVDSYRGLFPIIEVPPGAHGKLSLIYRPPWLIIGGTLSILCTAFWILSVVASAATRGRGSNNSAAEDSGHYNISSRA
ncbi:MAG TPA: hypothetical protein VH170_09200 [Chthoniobacterales bacterium]|nr:hypothetical protein [Chthoniobacterales bacterium]